MLEDKITIPLTLTLSHDGEREIVIDRQAVSLQNPDLRQLILRVEFTKMRKR